MRCGQGLKIETFICLYLSTNTTVLLLRKRRRMASLQLVLYLFKIHSPVPPRHKHMVFLGAQHCAGSMSSCFCRDESITCKKKNRSSGNGWERGKWFCLMAQSSGGWSRSGPASPPHCPPHHSFRPQQWIPGAGLCTPVPERDPRGHPAMFNIGVQPSVLAPCFPTLPLIMTAPWSDAWSCQSGNK